MSVPSPQYSVCTEEVLITLHSLRARPALMHFLLLLSFSYALCSALSAFQLTLSFADLICLSIQINLLFFLQLLNHKHFIGSTLTLTDMGLKGFGVKCPWRLVDSGCLILYVPGQKHSWASSAWLWSSSSEPNPQQLSHCLSKRQRVWGECVCAGTRSRAHIQCM